MNIWYWQSSMSNHSMTPHPCLCKTWDLRVDLPKMAYMCSWSSEQRQLKTAFPSVVRSKPSLTGCSICCTLQTSLWLPIWWIFLSAHWFQDPDVIYGSLHAIVFQEWAQNGKRIMLKAFAKAHLSRYTDDEDFISVSCYIGTGHSEELHEFAKVATLQSSTHGTVSRMLTTTRTCFRVLNFMFGIGSV